MNTQQLTFTRFIAATCIVLYHFAGNLFPNKYDFVQVLRGHFFLGVSYFYVLSGFVMILAYGNQNRINPKKYLIKRFARLYPLHIFTLGLTLLVSLFVSLNYLADYKLDPGSLILNISLLQAWFPSYSLTYNVPSWSISVELFFYATFPFVFNDLYKKMRFRNFALLTVLFWLICQIAMNLFYTSTLYGGVESLDRYFLHYNPFFHLNSFLVGLLFGGIYQRYGSKWLLNLDAWIVLMLPVAFLVIYLLRNLLLHNGLLAFIFGLLILFIAANKGKITSLFNHRFLIHLGNISFAMYLLQNPVFIFLRKIFKAAHVQNDYLLFGIGFPALLVCSHYTYRWVELPLQKKIHGMAHEKKI